MIVKICGMRDADNIREIERLGIDWMGFIFYEGSARHILRKPAYLPDKARRVGVFVNERPERIVEIVADFDLSFIQLHGDETPETCRILRTAGQSLIKAFPIASEKDFQATEPFESLCDYYLFDTKTSGYGGSGTSFDWSLLRHYHGTTPFLLSGGIGPDDAEAILKLRHPRFAGIDLNSRFEIVPGRKDPETVRNFLAKIRK